MSARHDGYPYQVIRGFAIVLFVVPQQSFERGAAAMQWSVVRVLRPGQTERRERVRLRCLALAGAGASLSHQERRILEEVILSCLVWLPLDFPLLVERDSALPKRCLTAHFGGAVVFSLRPKSFSDYSLVCFCAEHLVVTCRMRIFEDSHAPEWSVVLMDEWRLRNDVPLLGECLREMMRVVGACCSTQVMFLAQDSSPEEQRMHELAAMCQNARAARYALALRLAYPEFVRSHSPFVGAFVLSLEPRTTTESKANTHTDPGASDELDHGAAA